MKGFKRFKVFYFSNDSRPHFNEHLNQGENIVDFDKLMSY